jgi:signal peptidase I
MSVAGYAPSQAQAGQQAAHEPRGPSPFIAGLLSFFMPGLGHLYIGQARRGFVLFALIIVANTALMFACMGVLARFWMLAVSFVLLLGLWLYILIDATTRAYRTEEYPQQRYCCWRVYLAVAVLAWLVNLTPFIYAVHARATGQLGWFRATVASMEPTLRAGEYFLANATFYRTHQPSRGDVVVYVHPQRPGEHYTRRIVGVEGDRVSVRNGRVVVNGIAVMEPYIAADRPGVLSVPEIQVPGGHVFVLGDNRAISFDQGEAIGNGLVPVKNLIGRATDIAFSHYLPRMGRWIGTPSSL